MKTGADYARTYRGKQRQKLQRLAQMEAALERIANSERAAGIYDTLGNVHIARQALAGDEQGE